MGRCEERGARRGWLVGDVENQPVGSFTYKDTSPYRYRVTVHLMKAHKIKRVCPERPLRKTKWFPLQAASAIAGQQGLRDLLATLPLHERYPQCRPSAIVPAPLVQKLSTLGMVVG